MRWTKLKQRIEERFAEELRGRLEVHVTRYRKSHPNTWSEMYEFWLTLDGEKIAELSDGKSYAFVDRRVQEIEAAGQIKFAKPEAYAEADEIMPFAFNVMDLFFSTLSMPLDDILRHKNLAVRALAIADARLGQRRLAQIDETTCSPLEQTILAARRQSKSKGREASDAVLAVGSPQ